LPSSRKIDRRRKTYLGLASQIESQLREAYARKHAEGAATQSGLAKKLGINRSAVHHRLTGQTNMTIETIADMVWALDQAIQVRIYDPMLESDGVNYRPIPHSDNRPKARPRSAATTTDSSSELELA
jgi:hypothetical protein